MSDGLKNLKSCIFCRIVERKEPAEILYEDEKVMALLDLKPFNPGHSLVIPKEHFENIYDIPEDVIAQLYRIVKRVAVALKKAMDSEGISIIQSNEAGGSQGIFHFHTHVIPRYFSDELSRLGPVWESAIEAEKDELRAVSKAVKKFMKQ